MRPNLLPDRACGSCNVCCVDLAIDERRLQKLPGYTCENAQADGGCAIYSSRPQTCQKFFCGWRQLKFIKLNLRPDQSGVLVRIVDGGLDERGRKQPGVSFTLLNEQAVKAEGLAESIAAAITAGLPTYLHVPGPKGFTSSQMKLNDAVGLAVLRRDKYSMLATISQLRDEAAASEHRPVVLSSW